MRSSRLQLVLCGDFLQLPSVDKNGGFIFDCPSWKAAIHETIELHVVFRQVRQREREREGCSSLLVILTFFFALA